MLPTIFCRFLLVNWGFFYYQLMYGYFSIFFLVSLSTYYIQSHSSSGLNHGQQIMYIITSLKKTPIFRLKCWAFVSEDKMKLSDYNKSKSFKNMCN